MFEKLEIIFDSPLLVGESPMWDEINKQFYFVDIRGNCFYKMDYASGKYEKTDVPQMLGCMAMCDNGDLLVSMEDGVYRRTPEGALTLAHKPLKIKGERFNDGKVGPDGLYYVGTAGADFSGAFYRLQDGVLTEMFDRCGCSNGIDWSADGKTLYYCDSREQKLERFDFSCEAHGVSNRQTITDIPLSLGSGDGMTIDAQGNLWLAVWGGSCVEHINSKTGEIMDVIEVPAKQVSSCCFAGDDLRDLIITTAAVRTDPSEQPLAGRIFRYRANVAGVPFNRYKGGQNK